MTIYLYGLVRPCTSRAQHYHQPSLRDNDKSIFFRRHTLLFKGSEDLRLDQRVMQLFRVVNALLSHTARPTDGLRAHHYGVVPIAPRAGLIEWVDNASSLFSFYKVCFILLGLFSFY